MKYKHLEESARFREVQRIGKCSIAFFLSNLFSKFETSITSYLRDRRMGLPPLERPNLISLMTLIKTVGHENKFSIFLTKTMIIAHFNTHFSDYFDHYAPNQQPIKIKDHITILYTKLSLFC